MRLCLKQGLLANVRSARWIQLWYAPMLVVAMGLMMIRILVMARLLDVPGFANYSAGLLVSSSFCMLGCLGVQSLLQRDLPMMIVRRRNRAGVVLTIQCVVVASVCALIGWVGALADLSLAGLSPAMFALALLHGLAQQLFLIATVDSRSRNKPVRFAKQNLDRALIVLTAGSLVAVVLPNPLVAIACEALISLAFASTLLVAQLRVASLNITVATRLAWQRLPAVRWRSAFTLLAVASLAFLIMNADRWLAAQLLNRAAFAQYAFAWTVLLIAQSAQVVVNAALYPLLARRFAMIGNGATFGASARASLGLLVVGVTGAIPLWWLLDATITRWFVDYQECRVLLPLFLCIAVLRVADFWSSYLVIIRRETLLMILNVTAIFVCFAFWLAQHDPFESVMAPINIASIATLLALTHYVIVALAAWQSARRATQAVI